MMTETKLAPDPAEAPYVSGRLMVYATTGCLGTLQAGHEDNLSWQDFEYHQAPDAQPRSKVLTMGFRRFLVKFSAII